MFFGAALYMHAFDDIALPVMGQIMDTGGGEECADLVCVQRARGAVINGGMIDDKAHGLGKDFSEMHVVVIGNFVMDLSQNGGNGQHVEIIGCRA